MPDPANVPVQILAVNGDDIKVYRRVTCAIQLNNKLHRHVFLVMALPQSLLGWDFLKDHHACIKAAPEVVHFLCKCPPPAFNAGPMRVLPR